MSSVLLAEEIFLAKNLINRRITVAVKGCATAGRISSGEVSPGRGLPCFFGPLIKPGSTSKKQAGRRYLKFTPVLTDYLSVNARDKKGMRKILKL